PSVGCGPARRKPRPRASSAAISALATVRTTIPRGASVRGLRRPPSKCRITLSLPTPRSCSGRSPPDELPLGQPIPTQGAADAVPGREAAVAAPRLQRRWRRLSGAAQPQLLVELRRPGRLRADAATDHWHRPGDALCTDRYR